MSAIVMLARIAAIVESVIVAISVEICAKPVHCSKSPQASGVRGILFAPGMLKKELRLIGPVIMSGWPSPARGGWRASEHVAHADRDAAIHRADLEFRIVKGGRAHADRGIARKAEAFARHHA